MEGGVYFGAAGGNWGRQPGAAQQHHQPSEPDPPSLDSTDPKVSAYFNVA